MKVLLDTHVILWALGDDPRLKARHRALLQAGETELIASAASIWEIEIKRALGKLEAPDDVEGLLLASGCRPLPISWRHAREAGRLPALHADPFDRLLVAQARVEQLALVTTDAKIMAYEVQTI